MSTAPALCDVGPRDGLQNAALTLSPAVRAELCDRLVGAGLRATATLGLVHQAGPFIPIGSG